MNNTSKLYRIYTKRRNILLNGELNKALKIKDKTKSRTAVKQVHVKLSKLTKEYTKLRKNNRQLQRKTAIDCILKKTPNRMKKSVIDRISHLLGDPKIKPKVTRFGKSNSSSECPVCLEKKKETRPHAFMCSSAVKHGVCKSCIEQIARTTKVCPFCRAEPKVRVRTLSPPSPPRLIRHMAIDPAAR